MSDPIVNAVACTLGVARSTASDPLRRQRAALVERALWRGPEALDRNEKMTLINDPLSLSRLHFAVWTSGKTHPDWRARP